MNKPLTMIVKETKSKLASICNESGLPPVILDLIMQGIYSEVHSLVERQAAEEEVAYIKAVKEMGVGDSDLSLEGGSSESE